MEHCLNCVALRELARSGRIPGPDVVAAGIYVTPNLGESVLADPRLSDLIGGVNTDDELRKLVNINIDRGVDVIKTRGTERAGLPGTDPRQQVYTERQLRIIVDEAASRGKSVMVHGTAMKGRELQCWPEHEASIMAPTFQAKHSP